MRPALVPAISGACSRNWKRTDQPPLPPYPRGPIDSPDGAPGGHRARLRGIASYQLATRLQCSSDFLAPSMPCVLGRVAGTGPACGGLDILRSRCAGTCCDIPGRRADAFSPVGFDRLVKSLPPGPARPFESSEALLFAAASLLIRPSYKRSSFADSAAVSLEGVRGTTARSHSTQDHGCFSHADNRSPACVLETPNIRAVICAPR
ncbi:uncharacterized protein UV8b_02265 [Ustilaginoidea virens]|uniref:Uncharacterized protein n=1 Tax=Ustilaginoidea virens TaxID=1159556 RepID=A0A8E5HMC2_USTVR|nr:uncharacterized protein UV8b_02265 [Ustilaginoidea virens]QUC18024.1 hypothetical protein UV8b_02265 [Ustilaginoidea virens]